MNEKWPSDCSFSRSRAGTIGSNFFARNFDEIFDVWRGRRKMKRGGKKRKEKEKRKKEKREKTISSWIDANILASVKLFRRPKSKCIWCTLRGQRLARYCALIYNSGVRHKTSLKHGGVMKLPLTRGPLYWSDATHIKFSISFLKRYKIMPIFWSS